MNADKPKLVIITGPTAAGKSSLAIDMALYFHGEIVNADSMQVYRGMDVGTAKPSIKERMGIPHHLLDIVDPDENFNAAIYRSFAEPILKEIASRNTVCFVVGGTGLYIKALLGGLFKSPPTDYDLREKLHQESATRGLQSLYEQLKVLDPESALNIHPHDKTRIIRALEIIHLTGQPFSSLIRNHQFKERAFQTLKISLDVDREVLYHRINNRSLVMLQTGLIEETQRLLDMGYTSELKAMKSLGYRHVIRYLNNEWDFEELVRKLQTDTRRYAKRQLTWFRADPEMIWIDPEDRARVRNAIEAFI